MPKDMSKTAKRTIEDIKNSDMEEMIESFAKDRTESPDPEMFLQEDQEIRGFSMGSRAAIKGYKYGGCK
jgi:hypothetical protein